MRSTTLSPHIDPKRFDPCPVLARVLKKWPQKTQRQPWNVRCAPKRKPRPQKLAVMLVTTPTARLPALGKIRLRETMNPIMRR
jgi:hypothetical protein